jgi:ATP-dependent Clp protease ATP-binding subunit ClpA
VFLFGGPTGVGKTETAAALAALLDPSPQGLIRVNCNVLQGGHQGKESVLWPLLGVPAGFVGHGDGGLLSPIREHPDCVVLFDEFEKADPAVGKMLLQILDTGQQEDNDGNLLDFRRAFLVFTTNLGCDYEAGAAIGFGGAAEGLAVPTVDRKAIFDELLSMGYGHEFLGRIQNTFLFRGLGADAIREIVGRLLERLTREAAERGYSLTSDPRVADDVVARWRPRLGVRHLHGLLLFRVRQALAIAEAEGRLEGVKEVRLVLPGDSQLPRSDRFDLVVE